MADKITIVNSALLKISEEPINSLDDNTKSSTIVSILWDIVLESLLSEHEWSFAKKRVTISPDTTTPSFGYSLRFGLPADYNHLVSIDSETEVDYVIEGRYILSNTESINLVYIANITDPTVMTGKFTLAFILILAANIAYALNGNTKEAQYIEQLGIAELEKAKMEDKTEIGLEYPGEPWEENR